MLDAADQAAFVDSDMPGYALATINGSDIPGLFGNGYHDGLGLVDGNSPIFRATPASVAAVARGNTVVISSISYTVGKIAADGITLTKLYLER